MLNCNCTIHSKHYHCHVVTSQNKSVLHTNYVKHLQRSELNAVNKRDVCHPFCKVHILQQPTVRYGFPYSHTSIFYSVYDEMETCNGILPKALGIISLTFVTRTNVSVCNVIKFYNSQNFNTIILNAFSDTRIQRHNKLIHSNSCFVNGLFKTHSFKILLLRGTAT